MSELNKKKVDREERSDAVNSENFYKFVTTGIDKDAKIWTVPHTGEEPEVIQPNWDIKAFVNAKTMAAAVDSTFFKAQVAYVGYSPAATVNMMKARAIKANISKQEMMDNVDFAIGWVTNRGTKITPRAVQRTSATTKATLGMIIKRYQIQPTGEGKTYGPDVLTFARIALTFASFTAVAQFISGRDPVGERSPIDVALPLCFRFSGAPSLFPKNSDYFPQYIQWAVAFDKIINEKTKKYTPVGQIIQYAKISLNSPLYDNEDRTMICSALENINAMEGTKAREVFGGADFKMLEEIPIFSEKNQEPGKPAKRSGPTSREPVKAQTIV